MDKHGQHVSGRDIDVRSLRLHAVAGLKPQERSAAWCVLLGVSPLSAAARSVADEDRLVDYTKMLLLVRQCAAGAGGSDLALPDAVATGPEAGSTTPGCGLPGVDVPLDIPPPSAGEVGGELGHHVTAGVCDPPGQGVDPPGMPATEPGTPTSSGEPHHDPPPADGVASTGCTRRMHERDNDGGACTAKAAVLSEDGPASDLPAVAVAVQKVELVLPLVLELEQELEQELFLGLAVVLVLVQGPGPRLVANKLVGMTMVLNQVIV